MKALFDKIQDLRQKFKDKNNEYWKESQAFKDQQNQERAERSASFLTKLPVQDENIFQQICIVLCCVRQVEIFILGWRCLLPGVT